MTLELSEHEKDYGVLGLDAERWDRIPRSLQSAGFLHWSARSDRPKQPHANGDFYEISWSDPEDWLSFDDAASAASRTGSWGMGYVNGAENDDFDAGHRMTIDIDGAIDENGELRDWVPSFDPFFDRDAYMEFSVSYADIILGNDTDGAGIHIPVRKADVPDWWSDCEVAPDVHQGVDVLANKFCTITGAKHPKSGDSVVKYGKWLDEWLAEVYKRIEGEDPRRQNQPSGEEDTPEADTGSGTSTRISGDASEADVRDALAHVGHAAAGEDERASDYALHYDEWVNVAYAVHSWDDGENGREVFDDWTEDSPKYEEPDSSDPIDWIWQNATAPEDDNTNKITIGTLFHKAKQNGWGGPEDTSVEFDPAAEWGSWHTQRTSGELGADSIIPEPALRHIAEDREYYDFDAVGQTDTLPPKAHNRALGWVKNDWAEEFLGEDEEATARDYKPRDAAVYGWEDVRYIYDGDKFDGRAAARSLLKDKYTFMCVEGTEDLYVYNPDTGAYEERLGQIRGEIYDGLEQGGHWSTHETQEIIAGLRQHNRPKANELNGRGEFDNPHICLENCVLDLFTEEVKEHSPDYYFTDRIPHTYDPDADTQPYEDFLSDITRDSREADGKAMLEMVGHALTPDAHERGWKNFMVLFGGTNNGKSVFYDLVSHLLEGDDDDDLQNVMSVKLEKMSSNRFSKDAMYGSMANIAGEINGKKIRNTADIKDITGGDKMEIEPKGDASFSDTMNTTLMFAANDPPIIGDRDKEAIASRIVPIELPYKFVENPTGAFQRKKKPEDELKNELQSPEAVSGFLNLALEGIARLQDNKGDVSLPESHSERLDKYEKNADPMREFGQTCLENGTDDYIAKDDITAVYKEFANERGYEIGANVHNTLHGALSGLPGLQYSQTRPDPADYKDTSLPLKGYNERKRAAARVTLTEEGMEYAEAAGLVVEDSEEEDNSQTAGQFNTRPLQSAAESPTGYADVEAEVVKVAHPGEEHENAPAMKATLKDDSGAMDVVHWDDEDALEQGDTVVLEDAETTTFDGSVQLTIVDAVTEVHKMPDDDDQQRLDATAESTDASDTEAATDGGEEFTDTPDDDTMFTVPADATGPQADAQRIVDCIEARGPTEESLLQTILTDDMGVMTADEFEGGMRKATKQGDVQSTKYGVELR